MKIKLSILVFIVVGISHNTPLFASYSLHNDIKIIDSRIRPFNLSATILNEIIKIESDSYNDTNDDKHILLKNVLNFKTIGVKTVHRSYYTSRHVFNFFMLSELDLPPPNYCN